jgi:hypothetical protein
LKDFFTTAHLQPGELAVMQLPNAQSITSGRVVVRSAEVNVRRVGRFGRLAGLALMGASSFSCTTEIDSPDTEGGPSNPQEQTGSGGSSGMPSTRDPDAIEQACDERSGSVSLGLTKLRRLTRPQLDNTLRDLLSVTSNPSAGLSPDERMGPFLSNAISPITSLLVQQHQEMARAVAASVLPRRAEITGCSLETEGATCAGRFIDDFGLRAFRRPLRDEEKADFLALYTLGESGLGESGGGPENGFRLLLEAFLQSPSFIYHVDTGQGGVATAAPDPIDPYSFASRLSYFLWNTMPDDELFARAADGTLLDATVIETQIERMLADPRAGDTIASFHRQWLGLSDLSNKSKDPELYPDFGPEVAAAMLAETGRFADYVVRSGDGLLSTLFTAEFSFPEGPLFSLYGVEEPANFTPGDQVSLAGAHRAGILTQPAFLAMHAHQDQTSPVHRGIVVRENVLCQTMKPPPPGVNNVVPPRTESSSTRERIMQHRADPACAVCHDLIDPLGMAFENYDTIGAYRTTDGLGPVDASGTFTYTRDDLRGAFSDAIGMMAMLADASEVEDCVADQWLRFALGRVESLDDACSLVSIHEGFRAAGGNIRTLLGLIAKSDAFRHVRSTAGTEAP